MSFKKQKAKEAYLKAKRNSKINFFLAFLYAMEEQKRFLDSELTLAKIALELNVSQGHLSRIINSSIGMSFNDYVNTLRVNEAKLFLKSLDDLTEDIMAIALKSGFNSKSTFYHNFKKLTGQTPNQFKHNSLNKSEMMT